MKKLIVSVACFTAFVLPLWTAEISITILHTNDIHQHLDPLPRIAGYAAAYRKEHPNTVFVDAGDFFDRGASLVPLTRGEAVYGAMAHMGYDMWILGNHDWAYGGSRLRELMTLYPVPVLGTNLGTTRPPMPDNLKRTIIKEFEGIRVGFFGITLDTYGKSPKGRPNFYVLDCHQETAKAVAELKQANVDIIVAITHLGLRKMEHETRSTHPSDIELAKTYPDIDVIIGGHSHTLMAEAETRTLHRETGAIIVQAGAEGRCLGRLTLIADPDARLIKRFEIERIKPEPGLPEEPEVARFIQAFYDHHMPNAKRAAGELKEPFEFHNMAYWYADFIQVKTQADIVLLPRKTLYDEPTSFSAGTLSVEQLFGILYDRYLIKSTVTGAALLQYCNQEGIRDRFNPFHHRRRPFSGDALFFSGFETAFDAASQEIRFTLEPEKMYTLVTPWPFAKDDIARHRHLLPVRTAVKADDPVPGLTVSKTELLPQTTRQLLGAGGFAPPLTFHRKHPTPQPDWPLWTKHFEAKLEKQPL